MSEIPPSRRSRPRTTAKDRSKSEDVVKEVKTKAKERASKEAEDPKEGNVIEESKDVKLVESKEDSEVAKKKNALEAEEPSEAIVKSDQETEQEGKKRDDANVEGAKEVEAKETAEEKAGKEEHNSNDAIPAASETAPPTGSSAAAEEGTLPEDDDEDDALKLDPNVCRFAPFGCDIEGNDHDAKRPMKHLGVLNDAVVEKFHTINKILDMEEDIQAKFVHQRFVTNSVMCRESVQLLWPVSDFHEHVRTAKTKLGGPLISPPFSTDTFGYQMQAILLPYGRNRAFGKYMGFFVQIIPGEYDAILRWPFQDTLTFTLYDQNREATKRMDFRFELLPETDPISLGFLGRPRPDTPNGWLGTDQFVAIESVMSEGEYIVDNIAYFSVSVR